MVACIDNEIIRCGAQRYVHIDLKTSEVETRYVCLDEVELALTGINVCACEGEVWRGAADCRFLENFVGCARPIWRAQPATHPARPSHTTLPPPQPRPAPPLSSPLPTVIYDLEARWVGMGGLGTSPL